MRTERKATKSASQAGMPAPPEKLRVGLIGMFGIGNFGNEASLEAMLAMLRRTAPYADPVVICANPELVSAAHRVEALAFSPRPYTGKFANRLNRGLLGLPVKVTGWMEAVAATRQLDALVVPGTGILDDYGTGPQGMPYALFRWFSAARLNGVNTALFAIGAGPIHNRTSRWLMTRAAAVADYRSYRELPSRNYMTGLGFDTSRDRVCPDIAFALEVPSPGKSQRDSLPPVVGLGLMTYRGWSGDAAEGHPQFAHYIVQTGRLLSLLLDRGHRVRIITGETGDDAGVEAVLEAALPLVREEFRPALVWEKTHSLSDVIREASQTDVVVASRFHNIVGALLAGKPAISLGYAVKNRALLESYGLGGYCHDIGSFDPEAIIAQITRLDADAQRVEAAIRTRTAEARRELAVEMEIFATTVLQPRRRLFASGRWGSAYRGEVSTVADIQQHRMH